MNIKEREEEKRQRLVGKVKTLPVGVFTKVFQEYLPTLKEAAREWEKKKGYS